MPLEGLRWPNTAGLTEVQQGPSPEAVQPSASSTPSLLPTVPAASLLTLPARKIVK